VQRRRWLNRFKALPAGGPLRRKRMERKPPKDTGPSLRVRRLVAKRAENRCEYPMCGLPMVCIHHRYERKRGGVGPKSPAIAWINEAVNLLGSCLQHNEWVSNQHPRQAHDMGWLWRSGDPPAAELPVHTSHYSVPVYLNFDGTWTPIEIPDETAGEESKKAA
jgi:hypothetical protein